MSHHITGPERVLPPCTRPDGRPVNAFARIAAPKNPGNRQCVSPHSRSQNATIPTVSLCFTLRLTISAASNTFFHPRPVSSTPYAPFSFSLYHLFPAFSSPWGLATHTTAPIFLPLEQRARAGRNARVPCLATSVPKSSDFEMRNIRYTRYSTYGMEKEKLRDAGTVCCKPEALDSIRFDSLIRCFVRNAPPVRYLVALSSQAITTTEQR
jgi:hypothetical protein